MRTFRTTLFVLLSVIILMAGTIGSVSAQEAPDAVVNFEFQHEAQWLAEPYFALMGGATNVRAIPTQTANEELFTAASGTTVEVVAEYNSREWLLGRFWNRQGVYLGHGWFNRSVANLNTAVTVTDEDALPPCTLTDEGEQVFVIVRFNEGWTHDTMSTSCTLFYEGRQEETEMHHYWIIRDNDGSGRDRVVENSSYLRNGFIWLLEGTGWIHSRTWNVGRGFSAGVTGLEMRYPPMVAYFARDKQQVMRDNGYTWPIRVNLLDGSHVDFEFGAFGGEGEVNEVDRCDITQPRDMNITGIFVSDGGFFRSTSVGALGCRTLILWQLPDGSAELLMFTGARERLEYAAVYSAVLLPSSWNATQVTTYVTQTVLATADLPAGTTVTNNGVPGMPESFPVE